MISQLEAATSALFLAFVLDAVIVTAIFGLGVIAYVWWKMRPI